MRFDFARRALLRPREGGEGPKKNASARIFRKVVEFWVTNRRKKKKEKKIEREGGVHTSKNYYGRGDARARRKGNHNRRRR